MLQRLGLRCRLACKGFQALLQPVRFVQGGQFDQTLFRSVFLSQFLMDAAYECFDPRPVMWCRNKALT